MKGADFIFLSAAPLVNPSELHSKRKMFVMKGVLSNINDSSF